MEIEEILREAVKKGYIRCRDCGNHIEPDAEECHCGWKNPIVELGMI